MLKKLKNNLVLGFDLKSTFKSVWIGPLLITWRWDDLERRVRDFDATWYGLNYWDVSEIE